MISKSIWRNILNSTITLCHKELASVISTSIWRNSPNPTITLCHKEFATVISTSQGWKWNEFPLI